MIDRVLLRREVLAELRNVRTYRQALRTPEAYTHAERVRMSAWVCVSEELLQILAQEHDGKNKAEYASELYGLKHKPRGSARYVNAVSMHKYHMSEDGLRRWRDNALFCASILAVKHHAIDLSSAGVNAENNRV